MYKIGSCDSDHYLMHKMISVELQLAFSSYLGLPKMYLAWSHVKYEVID